MNNIDKAIWEFSSVLDRDGIHIYVKNPLLMNLRKFYKIDRIIQDGMPRGILSLIEEPSLNVSRELIPAMSRKLSVLYPRIN